MNRKKNRILGVLLILVCVLGAVGFWQRNNLAALKLAMQNPQEDLVSQMEDSRKELIDAAQEHAGITVRDLTDEEKQALRDDPAAREDVIEQIIGTPAPVSPQPAEPETPPKTDPQDKTPVKPAKPVPQPAKPSKSDLRAQLDRCVAELYVMQEEYTSWLAQANQAAIDEFAALPAEKQTSTQKYKIGMRYMSMATEKERECDARVAALEKEIKRLLTELGEDTQLVTDIHKTYLDEKALQKAYYLGLHG